MNIFVISLKDNNSIRKEHMLNEFSKCQLNFTSLSLMQLYLKI